MPDSTYSVVDDLLLGDLPVSATVNKQKFVNDAADEIDSRLGFVYETPLPMDGTMERHAELTIKRVANNLASGRLILMLASPTEQRALHAYGQSLVNAALADLGFILAGTLPLDGATKQDADVDQDTGPSVKNLDSASAVEAFYGDTMGTGPLRWTGPVWEPGT